MVQPLIDLHLHLDGSLSLASARQLAKLQGIAIPETDDDLRNMLSVSPGCRDLNEYLEKFDFPCSLLQTKEAIAQAVYTLKEELRQQGLLYAEIRFAPQKHTDRGLSQREVVEAAVQGQNRSDFPTTLILCCMRGDDNRAENLETVRVAAEFLGKGVGAVDLAGAEALFPTENFGEVFRLAVENGVPFTIHAGEADGPESVKTAMAFGAKRIGHGVRSVEDPALLARLAAEGVTLELCPTSNLNTCVFSDIREYPLSQLLEAGVRVTVNTDNTAVSRTDLKTELILLAETLGLTREQQKRISLNAADAAFAGEGTKAQLKTEIEKRFR